MAENPFADQSVLITGASRGIGREMALQLAGQGALLTLAARASDSLDATTAECREHGARVLPVRTDVAVQEECRKLVESAVAAHGRLDTLICNAGITMWALFEEIDDLSMFERLMRVNYLGSVYCTHYALAHLKESRGRIVGVASLTAKTGVPTRSGYAASKHAMAGFFDTLRIELADAGVSVTMAYPDFVATDVRKRAFGPDGKPLGTSPVHEDKVMPADVCARLVLEAAAARKREIVMSRRGRLGQWLKLLAPGLIDRLARRAITRGR
jgi:NAD(P)-dependent dehydrogenase (short-subunit alcohol dehydrogenase family)